MTRMTKAGLRGYVQFNKYTHTHTQTHTHTHTHTHTNRKIVVDAVRETGETRVESEKKCRKERVGSVAANPDNLESNKEAGGGAQGSRAQVRFVQVERACPLCRV